MLRLCRNFLRKGAIQMMDRERTEKELQEIFEEIQHSYKTLVDNAFTLQERTLEIARALFESSAQEKSHHTEATLEELARTHLISAFCLSRIATHPRCTKPRKFSAFHS
jgi:hypothetical protein